MTMTINLTQHLSLVSGDIFQTKMQTLTVPVNTVGVMGAGLAKAVKERYPEVYWHYRELCNKGLLRMGRPYVYRPDKTKSKTDRWFLLFPTKRHWKEDADIKGIEEGLQWLVENYKAEGITSLSVPALGAGLGRLDWGDVGPLMCRYLQKLDIPTEIYLPHGKTIPKEQLSREFLLGQEAQPFQKSSRYKHKR